MSKGWKTGLRPLPLPAASISAEIFGRQCSGDGWEGTFSSHPCVAATHSTPIDLPGRLPWCAFQWSPARDAIHRLLGRPPISPEQQARNPVGPAAPLRTLVKVSPARARRRRCEAVGSSRPHSISPKRCSRAVSLSFWLRLWSPPACLPRGCRRRFARTTPVQR